QPVEKQAEPQRDQSKPKETPRREKEPDPVKDAEPDPTSKKKSSKKEDSQEESPKHVIQPNLTQNKRPDRSAAIRRQMEARAQAEAEEKSRAAQAARVEALNRSVNSLKENLSTGTAINFQ